MINSVAKLTLRRSAAIRYINQFRKDTDGATSVEYGLIVALIFLAIIGAVKNFGATTNQMYNEIETEINSVVN